MRLLPLWTLFTALLALAGWQLAAPEEEDASLIPTLLAGPATPPRVPAATPPAAGDFSAIVERPLFSPERRRAAIVVPAAIAAPPPPPRVLLATEYELIGMAVEGPRATVLLRPAGGGATLRLRSGERLRDWTLTGVDERQRVVFQREGEQQVLERAARSRAVPEDDEDDADDEPPPGARPASLPNVLSPVRRR